MKKWEEDLYMFHCATAPKEKKSLQEYIELYLTEKDERYFNYFLHFYEPKLNDKIYGIVQNYAMQGHFADLKMALSVASVSSVESMLIGKPFSSSSHIVNEPLLAEM